MSNVATVQSVYEAFGGGDLQAILDRLAADVVWEQWSVDNTAQEADVPWVRPRSGRDGVAGFFQDLAENLDIHAFEPTNLMEGGNQVAATIRIDATVKPTGERFQDEEIHLWTFDDQGKISSMRHYMDTAKHVKAMKKSPAGVA